MWRKKIIIFLIRTRLGVKLYEKFRFANQLSPYQYYYFTETNLRKNLTGSFRNDNTVAAGVSLNWLLDDHCQIEKIKEGETVK